MRAGFGKQELTPPMGVELAGYGYYLGRRALSVRDPLYARALLLENSGMSALIISCDLLGLSRTVCEDVFAYAASLGISPEHVIIVSIHTHTGPTIKYHEGTGYVDDDYVRTVAPNICSAIDAALNDMADVESLEFLRDSFEGNHIYNRTIENGPVDRNVRGFFLARAGKPSVTIVSAACHGVFRGRSTSVSADFAGEICRILDSEGVNTIYLNGLCGDIDPTKQDDALLDDFARLIVAHLRGKRRTLPLTLEGGRLPFTLKLLTVTKNDIRQAAQQAVRQAGGPDSPAARVALIWEQEMLDKFASLAEHEDITVKYLLLGGVPIAAFPFEGFTQIGQDVRRLCECDDALLLGCAEELLGYLPTRDDIARGTYAALESTFLYKRLPVVPGEAERLGEEIGVPLKEILQTPPHRVE